MLMNPGGRRGQRLVVLFALLAMLLPGCSRKAAQAPRLHNPQQLEEELVRASDAAPAVADGDARPAETPAEPDTNQRLKVKLDATSIQPGEVLRGNVVGDFGKDIVRALWLDGNGRVLSDAEASAEGRFEFKVPATAGYNQRIVLVRADRGAVEKSQKDGKDPFQVQAQAAFTVATAAGAEGWKDYRVILGESSAHTRDWSALRQNGINVGWSPFGAANSALQKSGTPSVATALPADRYPLMLSGDGPAEAFDDAFLQNIIQRMQSGVTARSGQKPLAWALLEAPQVSAGEVAEHAENRDHTASTDVYRAWLEERYDTLANLNARWGVTYKEWSDVHATLTEDIKSEHNAAYAAKLQPPSEKPSAAPVVPKEDLPKVKAPEVAKDTAKPPVVPSPNKPVAPVVKKEAPKAPATPAAPANKDAKQPEKTDPSKTDKPARAKRERPARQKPPPKNPPKPADKVEKMEGEPVPDFTLEPDELRVAGGENFTAWCDARSFDDFTNARLLREYRKQLRALDPDAACGLLNAHVPSAWGGWDWYQFPRSIDWLEEHRAPYTRAMARSFAPKLQFVSKIFAGQPSDVYALWSRWLSGDAGCILAGEKTWIEKGAALSPDAAAIAPDLKELTSGLTLQRNLGRLADDGIAIWYSPRSVQLHWMLDSESDGNEWRHRDADTDLRQSSSHLQFQAWTMLLEDLGYAPRFVHPQQAIAGALANGVKVLVLPKVLSISEAEAHAIREFAMNGGIVIADGACGTFDGTGRRRTLFKEARPTGILDADFGIARKDLALLERNGTFSGNPDVFHVLLRDVLSGQPIGPESNELRVLEPGISSIGAQTHAHAKGEEGKAGAPALLMKQAGMGRFVYLNLSFQDYPVLRGQPAAEGFRFHGMTREEYAASYGEPTGGEALRLVVSDVLADALTDNPLKVRTEAGVPLRGIRRVSFDMGGGARLFGLLPSAAIAPKPEGEHGVDLSGLPFQEATTAWVGLETPMHWYETRSGKYLGHAPMVKTSIDPFRANLLTALPYEVQKLSIKIRRLDRRGAFKLTAAMQVSGGSDSALAGHVLHVDVLAPDGTPLPQYACSLTAVKGQWTETVVLGLNEPAGAYKVVVRDVLSGKRGEGELVKDASAYDLCCPLATPVKADKAAAK